MSAGDAPAAQAARLYRAVRRVARKPPHVIARRLLTEIDVQVFQRHAARHAEASFTTPRLLRATEAPTIDALWSRVTTAPFPAITKSDQLKDLDRYFPDERARVLRAAEDAVLRRVNVLGSGPVDLGVPTNWSCDVKSGIAWPLTYVADIDYADLSRGSDVKVPWEISRFHWLLPAGQAYLLTGDEGFAKAARDAIDEWISANPYASSVNWASAMEVALRVIAWTWLIQAFGRSATWTEGAFRERILKSLFLHCVFTDRNLEWSEVRGNHYVSNATGLVFGGLFFTGSAVGSAWHNKGWRILQYELPLQVLSDGVDFEASATYHRFVCELFLLAALYRQRRALPVPPAYVQRLAAMADFAASYTRADGTVPRWGDVDDARVLPLAGHGVDDHRYLAAVIHQHWDLASLHDVPQDGRPSEALWLSGVRAVKKRPTATATKSRAFHKGGVYIMRTARDHVFIDCGPVGLNGRGGHGHNDCLSFEAVLDGVLIVTDCGSFVYTASPACRNNFRSTRAHNTPMVDGHEQNRILDPISLWTLEDDAEPTVHRWETTPTLDVFEGSHAGYQRLNDPVTPRRTITLDRLNHRLLVVDSFEGGNRQHDVVIPLHLSPGTRVVEEAAGRFTVRARHRNFIVAWDSADAWTARIRSGYYSPSYGVKIEIPSLEFHRHGPLERLHVALMPASVAVAAGALETELLAPRR